jgi:uncharacterized protein (DUF1810 family)
VDQADGSVMDQTWDLERFVVAQGNDDSYDAVLAELRRGRKTSHWMWYVFPQVAGLGHSPMSQRYAISSVEEARAYLEHPVLGTRLLDAARIVGSTQGRTADQIFGPVDAQKLRSSMTLFLRAAPHEPVFSDVLQQFYAGEPDATTDRLLGL